MPSDFSHSDNVFVALYYKYTIIHNISVFFSFFCLFWIRYVKHPEGRRISSSYLQDGNYQIEVMGKRYDAIMHIRSPFDPNGKRILGIYDEPLPIRQ